MSKICILFAGPIGSGKTPIANYLSYKLDLPVLNSDTIRVEVIEDLLHFEEKEFDKRRADRLREITESGTSFIYDASIDRKWKEYKELATSNGYTPIIISLDFSKEKLVELYKAKGYTAFDALDRTFEDHKRFLEQYSTEVSVSIKDEEFSDRLQIAYRKASEIISGSIE